MGGAVWLDYTVTHLEMTARPETPPPPPPRTPGLALIAAEDPPARWFLHLYRSVGAAHEWTDWLRRPAAELDAFLGSPDVKLYALMAKGWSAGFFVLDRREPGTCDLAYFGLAPEAQGLRLGGWLLGEAVRAGWAWPGVRRMTVSTNTLDHPRALPLYQKAGFVPCERESKRRRATARHERLPKA